MLHLLPVTTHRIVQWPTLCLVLSAACNLAEPTAGPPPLRTDQTQYLLGYGVWDAPMRVSYTNTRSDTVYFLLACWGEASMPGRHAERVDGSGRDVFVAQEICALGSSGMPPAVAVAPGATFVDTASLHVSQWAEGDSAGSMAAITGRFQLVYDLCITAGAASSATCDTLPRAERVTNAFEVVGPAP